MSLWRLEWLRLTRTRRWITPVAVFLLFGLIGPLSARYLGELLSSVGGLEVVLPTPTPVDGFAQYVSNASQLGVLAVVVVAAASLSIDQPSEMGIFLRTRVRRPADLLVPRVATLTALAVAAWVGGCLAAWYETVVVLGTVSAPAVLVGTLYGALYLAFVVTLVAALAGRGSSTMTTSLWAVGVLIVLPVVALVPWLERWVPSELVGALVDLVGGASLTEYVPAAITAVTSSTVLLGWAIRRVGAIDD